MVGGFAQDAEIAFPAGGFRGIVEGVGLAGRSTCAGVVAGESPTFQAEVLTPEERALETLIVQLRRSDGIQRPAFQEQTGYHLDSVAGETIARHVELGFIADDGQCVRLTRAGKCVADALICELMK